MTLQDVEFYYPDLVLKTCRLVDAKYDAAGYRRKQVILDAAVKIVHLFLTDEAVKQRIESHTSHVVAEMVR